MRQNRFLLAAIAVAVCAACQAPNGFGPSNLVEDQWPNIPCPPGGPVGGPTVEMKLDEIINLAAQYPGEPGAQACSTKALELKTFQPADPLQGSEKVSTAATRAGAHEWIQCKEELDQVH